MLTVTKAQESIAWNSFLATQKFRPFLQSWEMGEVYRDIGQEPVRLEVREADQIVGICFGHVVPARRGRHLSIPYGPVLGSGGWGWGVGNLLRLLLEELTRIAKDTGCSFIRISPFWTVDAAPILNSQFSILNSPLHFLAEHLWYLPLVEPDPWDHTYRPFDSAQSDMLPHSKKGAEDIFKSMRATTRNLIRRAEKEGVTITASDDPLRDLPLFLKLHEETRKRHSFTPYTNAFFRAQVKHFSPLPAHRSPLTAPHCSLYLAYYKGVVIAASIHMHFGGETSYHHGASTEKYRNIPASYLLQGRAIQDALTRGDHIYNFWGIAPSQSDGNPIVHTDKTTGDGQRSFLQEKQPQSSPEVPLSPCKKILCPPKHPFAGVTLFKTGFGGKPLELQHCMDLPLKPTYYITRGFELLRKWHRGF